MRRSSVHGLVASLLVGCGAGGSARPDADPETPDAGADASAGDAGDVGAPTATVVAPGNGLVLTPLADVVIRFSESMDPSSLVLGGVLAAESAGPVWSTATSANDTLTVGPQGQWTAGVGRALIVDARDLGGNSLEPFAPEFDVAVGTFYYVSAAAADDGGDGLSPATAKLTIQAAITAATPPAAVLVAEGSYPVETGTPTEVVLREGVSLFGGHKADFTVRDPRVFTSTVTDQSTSESSVTAPNRAITAGGGITPATGVSGFTLVGGGGDTSAAIHFMASTDANPTIHGNVISGGAGISFSIGVNAFGGSGVIVGNTIHAGSGGVESYGVRIDVGNATIEENVLDGGSGSTAVGIFIANTGRASIARNTITGGTGGAKAQGIHVSTASTEGVTIRNNVIHGGIAPADTAGIVITGGPGPVFVENNSIGAGSSQVVTPRGIECYGGTVYLRNNLVFSTEASAICVYEGNTTPAEVRNNDFYCSTVYRNSEPDCDGQWECTLAQLEALTDVSGGVSGNISVDPALVDANGPDDDPATIQDNDWRLSAASPLNLRGGGRASTGFGDDRVGAPRTTGTPAGMTNLDAAGWSIGAHELD